MKETGRGFDVQIPLAQAAALDIERILLTPTLAPLATISLQLDKQQAECQQDKEKTNQSRVGH